jgi:SAM-dependent methyltransferase
MSADPSDQFFQNYLQHYRNNGTDHWQVTLDKINEFHLERLPRWLPRVSKSSHILDAGCATGYLLELLWGSGYDQLTGVELSEQLATVAQASLPPAVVIVNSDIQNFLKKIPDESFDVIFFHHVLEHIPRDQTINLLREFHRSLKPNGYLNIKVPNASYILAGNHLFCDFTHVVHFNERSIPQVLEAAGFNTSKLEFVLHPPILFWSWQHPLRVLLRIFNRLRWHLHSAMHKALCILVEQRPVPRIFEAELEALIRK